MKQDVKSIEAMSENKKCNYNFVYKMFSEKKCFWDNFRGELEKTAYRDKKSENSLSFKRKDDTDSALSDVLKRVFDVTEKPGFKQIINSFEKNRFLTLHSSSLLAFLCFQDIDENNTLKLFIDNKECCFSKVEFESKFSFYFPEMENKKSTSHIDIKLTGKNVDNEDVTLLLESKFAEHVVCCGCSHSGISKAYSVLLEKIKELDINLKYDAKGSLCISSNKKQYNDGLKQMMAHFWAVKNNLNNLGNVYLGTILFDWSQVAGDENYGNYSMLKNVIDSDKNRSYQSSLASMATVLNAGNNGFKLLPEALTYQDVFLGNIENSRLLLPDVKDFYF